MLNIDNNKQKKAVLLNLAGQATQEIFGTISETNDDLATAVEKHSFSTPKKNVAYEIFLFRISVLQSGETVNHCNQAENASFYL